MKAVDRRTGIRLAFGHRLGNASGRCSRVVHPQAHGRYRRWGELCVSCGGVFLSNLPESMAASYGLDKAGWKRSNTVWMWTALVALSAGSAALGFAVFSDVPTLEGAVVQAFAAGALLTMLTMMPEAFDYSGKAVGLFTVLGFGVAIAISSLD